MSENRARPALLKAGSLDPEDLGVFEWDATLATDYLTCSNGNRSVEWTTTPIPADAGPDDLASSPPVWIPIPTRAYLHSGVFQWDFVVEEMAKGQIGVGFMLDCDIGPDWGFFGYLGSSNSAWAYDPSTGDVVCSTRSIEGGLPKFEDRRSGVVTVRLDLPREAEGSARFVVNGIASSPVALPEGAVVVPAGCLLEKSQRVSLAHFLRTDPTPKAGPLSCSPS